VGWGTRIWIIAGQDQARLQGHDVLAVISIAFGLVAAWIGVRGLRARRSP
jgi:hypothetical protein